jgi:hypothetical protein
MEFPNPTKGAYNADYNYKAWKTTIFHY